MPRLLLGLLLSLGIASAGSAVTMDWTFVGDPGNACEAYGTTFCFGGVAETFWIGTYEVTTAQYTDFLNSVASSDPYELYDSHMGNTIASGSGHGGIVRSGSLGTYTYSVVAGRENLPVNWVSLYDAMRFTNWLNNGQGSAGTETGAYTLLGGTPTPSNGPTVTRNAAATVFLPSEDEWYKAAYYDSSTSSFFDYATGSNSPTICSSPTADPNHANCGRETADFTVVGSYPGSLSPSGTFDQAGNVHEWTETIYQFDPNSRIYRGGSFWEGGTAANFQNATGPWVANYDRGFRVATSVIPEPSTGLLVIGGLLGIARWRRGRC